MGKIRPDHVDHHAAPAHMHELDRPSRGVARYDADPDLDGVCPAGCTPHWQDGGWRHDYACIARPRTR